MFDYPGQVGLTFADRDYVEEFSSTRTDNDVWRGSRAVVRDRVSIRDGAIVEAGAVVVRDVSPYSIVGGRAARLIGRRFLGDATALLLELRWWEKGHEWLRAHYRALHDLEALRMLARNGRAGT